MATIYGYHEYQREGREWNFLKLDSESDVKQFIGLELETEPNDTLYNGNGDYYETRQKIADYLNELFNEHIISSTDSTLRNGGLELVFDPRTPNYFIDELNNGLYQRAFDFISENNFRSHNGGRCGLHIHFTRPYTKNSDEDREFVNKLYFIFESFKDAIKIASRRTNYDYCEYYSDEYARYHEDKREFKSIYNLNKMAKEDGHSTAINNGNDKTIEIRILRGTLNHDTFKASIKLMIKLFNLAFKDIKDLNNITLKQVIKDDKDIKEYLKIKGVDTSVKLYDYSKVMIKLENIKRDILLKINKLSNKLTKEYLKDLKKIKLDGEDYNEYYRRVDTIINILNRINNRINNINSYIERNDYSTFNDLLNDVREFIDYKVNDNEQKQVIKKEITKLLNKELND